MNPMPEITTQLKQLRLSGVQEILAQRNREAVAQKLSHLEFLSLVLQDEILRREQHAFNKRIKRAEFRGNKTIENFDFGFNDTINIKAIKDMASCQFIKEKAPALIVGPCGTGKSHIAQAIGHNAIRLGFDVLFISQSKLTQQLQAAKALGTYTRRLNQYIKAHLLIIDDFGLKPLRTPQDEDLHDLIAERYERGATMITSNLDIDEWGEAFPNKLLGIATIDRLRHNAYKIILEGKSYRAERNTNKNG